MSTIKILGIVLGLVVLSAAILVAAPVKKAKAADDSTIAVEQNTQDTDDVNAQWWYGRGFNRGYYGGWYGYPRYRSWYGYPYYRGWYGSPYYGGWYGW